jgi:hypothetical protein
LSLQAICLKSTKRRYLTLEAKHTCVLFYGEDKISDNWRIISIDPLDPDSVERIGGLIRRILLLNYIENIFQSFSFKPLLRDFVKHIESRFITFDTQRFTYHFHSYPKIPVPHNDLIKKLELDPGYNSKKRLDKEAIIGATRDLLNEIEQHAIRLQNDYLNCFHCGEHLRAYAVERLDYIQCPSCNCLIDSSKPDQISMRIQDPKTANLAPTDFGMDFLMIIRNGIGSC